MRVVGALFFLILLPVYAQEPLTSPVPTEMPRQLESRSTSSASSSQLPEEPIIPMLTDPFSLPQAEKGQPDGSLRDASVLPGSGATSSISALDADLPLHPDGQVTRLLVNAAMLEKQAREQKYGKPDPGTLLKLYEQIALRACAPDFARTFSIPRPLPNDFACIETLRKMKEFAPHHPMAACLELGPLSAECREYHAVQRTSSVPVQTRDSALYRLSSGTADKESVKNFKALQAQVAKVFTTREPLLDTTQRDALQRYLSVTCREYRIAVEPLPQESSTEQDPTRKALLEAIDKLGASNGTNEAKEKQFLRLVRLLPEPCSTTIAGIKKANIELASTPCYERGPLAPECIQALIRERQNGVRVGATHSQPKDALQGF